MGNSCNEFCDNDTSSNAPIESAPKTPSRVSRLIRKLSGKSEVDDEVCVPSTVNSQENNFARMNTLTKSDEELIGAALDIHEILRHLKFKHRKKLISKLNKFTFKRNETINNTPKTDIFLYIIQTGKVKAVAKSSKATVFTKGQSFGTSLTNEEHPSATTFICTEKCALWKLEDIDLRILLQNAKKAICKANYKVVKDLNLFRELNKNEIEKLLSVVEILHFPPGTVILRENEPGNYLYVIKSGSVACSVKNQKVSEMGEFDYFGEVALFGQSCRMATVISTRPVTLLSFERSKITAALGNSLETIVLDNCLRFSIEQSKYLHFMTDKQIREITRVAQIVKFPKGKTVIYPHSYKSTALYSVLKGSLICKYRVFRALECIGDKFILNSSAETYNDAYMANEDAIVAIYLREDLEKRLKILLKELESVNCLVRILESISVFQFVRGWTIQEIAKTAEIREFPFKTWIFREKDASEAFYILKKGRVQIMKNSKNVREVTKHSCFGERSVLLNEPWPISAVANTKVVCWILPREKLFSHLDKLVIFQMLRRAKLQDDNISLTDLQPVEEIGQGAFGKGILTVHLNSHNLYQVRYMDVQVIQKNNLHELFEKENNLLSMLDHSFVVKKIKVLRDSKRIYLVNEHVRGWDLYDVMQEFHIFKNRHARFYISCLVVALKYLHARKIAYRDLKPENIIIDQDGYPKLVDFDAAKIVNGRTYTKIGTPHYVAPEVALGKGYSFNADLWSLGIILYELLYGKYPFNSHNADPASLYHSIVHDQVKFYKNTAVHKDAKNFIKKLLKKDPYERWKAKDCKKHKWLIGVEWKDLVLRKFPAPFIPTVKSISEYKLKAQINSESIDEFIKRRN